MGRIRYPAAHGDHLFLSTAKTYCANTTVETSFFGSGHGSATLPAGHFLEEGTPLMLMMMGSWSKGASSTFTLKITTTQSGVTTERHKKIFSSARLGANTTGHWQVEGMMNCYATGTTGTIMFHGMLQLLENDSAEILGTHTETSEFTMDTTLPFTIDVTGQWSVADALNTIHSANTMIW